MNSYLPYIALVAASIAISSYIIHDADCELFARIVRTIKRKWLQHNIDGWQRDIKSIQAQRRNDELAEQAIKREIINARSQLLDLQ